MKNNEEINLVKLGQQFGVSFLPQEAAQYLFILEQLIMLGERYWPTDRAARRRMISCFAVMLQYEAANDEIEQILEEE